MTPESEAKATDMGLKGIWALVGNSTAMVLISALFVWQMFSAEARDKRIYLMFEHQQLQERQFYGKQMDRLERAIDRNSSAFEALTNELKKK